MRSLSLLCACLFFVAGCGEKRDVAPATGTYGPLLTPPSAQVDRARPDISSTQPWTNGMLSVIESELTPATLYYSSAKALAFFANMPQSGLGPPACVTIPTQVGPKIFTNGAAIDAAKLNESWLVVWFAGATGWTNWDSPWLITLQRRPTQIGLNSNGLSLTFSGASGYAAAMPLFGYGKPAHESRADAAVFQVKEKKKRVQTWKWRDGLPADPLSRARYWTSVLKEFPVYCEETFSVDRGHDAVTLRQSIHRVSWSDDWQTKSLKWAPVSAVLAHAFNEGFPATFSKKPFDMEILTPFGPILGIEGVDSYDVTLPVLRYVNETERPGPFGTNLHPTALTTLRRTLEQHAGQIGGGANAVNMAAFFAKALPYGGDSTNGMAVAALKTFIRHDLLRTNQSSRTAEHASLALELVWAYAHYSGDWDLVRERWPLLKDLLVTPAKTRWAAFGPSEVDAFGDQAGPALAMARLAYKAGDIDSYNYACHVFARELVQHFVKQRGLRYFHDNQPYHSMEPFTGEMFLSRIDPGAMGWRIDGPRYPSAERLFENRWLRFRNPDVARFHRELLPAESKRELSWLKSFRSGEQQLAGGVPSLVELRSLLLNEPPAQLMTNSTVSFSGSPDRVIATCLALLRTSQPIRYERLIPGAAPSPFVAGVEREVPGPNAHLTHEIVTPATGVRWPRAVWPAWKTPTGAPWNFGDVTAGTNQPVKTATIPLNWNTRVLRYN